MQFLKDSYEAAVERKFILGAKLVRGAYMEKERKRADEMNYSSPIQPNKESSDKDFDAGVRFCIDHLDKISLVVASYNERSNMLGGGIATTKRITLKSIIMYIGASYME